MMVKPYDARDSRSIIDFAKKLVGKAISTDYSSEIAKLMLSPKDKGQLGKVIEELYFQYKPNSTAKADFEEAGLELKSSGLNQLKSKEYRAKERLVLSIIDFMSIEHEDFSSFLTGKNAYLLLIFYLYRKGFSQLDSVIKLVGEWRYPEEDLLVIKNDWELIQKKISESKAHELSEADTFYLGACTKGSKGGNPRPQPRTNIRAKQRAFSLKKGYVNHIIATISQDNTEVYGKLITDKRELQRPIENVIISKFKPLLNKSVTELVHQFNLTDLNVNAKSYYASLTYSIAQALFNVPPDKKIEDYIEEFSKADIVIKTVRLKENGLPKEDISFPAFKFSELARESWDSSTLKEMLERKFLFVFFQYSGEQLYFKKAKFWNIPYNDLLQVQKVWVRTKEIIRTGSIVSSINPTGVRKTNFPNKAFSKVAHVRPHAQNAEDVYPLPVKDILTGLNAYTKHSFWLNNSYIRNSIYLK